MCGETLSTFTASLCVWTHSAVNGVALLMLCGECDTQRPWQLDELRCVCPAHVCMAGKLVHTGKVCVVQCV